MRSTQARYLFAIRMLHDRYACVRSVDVAHYLDISKASVSVAVRQLRDGGLIEVERDGNLLLTDSSRLKAERLRDRVSFFRRLLTAAGVEPSLALQDAVSFSWEMSEDSFEAFRALGAKALSPEANEE